MLPSEFDAYISQALAMTFEGRCKEAIGKSVDGAIKRRSITETIGHPDVEGYVATFSLPAFEGKLSIEWKLYQPRGKENAIA